MSCACGKNKFCKCSSISVKDLDEALNRIRAFIYCDSDSFFGNKRYGFPGCRDIKLYTKLSLVSNSLARQKADIVVNGEPSIKEESLQKLYETALDLTKDSCCKTETQGLVVDNSGKEAWEILHPDLVIKPKWVLYRNKLLASIDVGITIIVDKILEAVVHIDDPVIRKTTCEAVLTDPSIERMKCDIELEISVLKQYCELTSDVVVDTTPCEVDVELVSTSICKALDIDMERDKLICDLFLDLHRQAKACNIDPQLLTKKFNSDDCQSDWFWELL